MMMKNLKEQTITGDRIDESGCIYTRRKAFQRISKDSIQSGKKGKKKKERTTTIKIAGLSSNLE